MRGESRKEELRKFVFASVAKQSRVVSDIRRVPAVFDELSVLHARREAELRVLGQHQKLGTHHRSIFIFIVGHSPP
jgi:hypothetical protein